MIKGEKTSPFFAPFLVKPLDNLFFFVYNSERSCGSGGTGRRARLRGVWFYRTGSIPVSRTIRSLN